MPYLIMILIFVSCRLLRESHFNTEKTAEKNKKNYIVNNLVFRYGKRLVNC